MTQRGLQLGLWGLWAACLALGSACGDAAIDTRHTGDDLVIEQERAYRETHEGRFLSLADFEPRDDAPARQQVAAFGVFPFSEGQVAYTADRARTGSGSLAVDLPAKSSLVFAMPRQANLRNYTLLTMAIYSETLRDDLRLTLMSEAGNWTSARTLIRPGWNHVRFDIQRLVRQDDFDIDTVHTCRLQFVDSASPVRFWLDDVLLVDNRETLTPAPPGLVLQRVGLDYHIRLPGRDGIVKLVQGDDGLWRLGVHQATVKLAGPDEPLPFGGEALGMLGEHRVGDVELLEHNATRIRLAATWYFPARAGEWVSQGVRNIRWEYTILPDGRCVTFMRLNNAGGQPIGTVSVSLLGRKAAWSTGVVARYLLIEDFVGPIGDWSWQVAPTGDEAETLQQNFLQPAGLKPILARAGYRVRGDVDGDGFDESQGCYVLAGEKGHCRFRVLPGEAGLLRGVFRIEGDWGASVSINVDGQAIREFSRVGEDVVLFILPGRLDREAYVEVRGEAAGSAR